MSTETTKEIGAMSDEELSEVVSNALAPDPENPDNSEEVTTEIESDTETPSETQPESETADQPVTEQSEMDPVQTQIAELSKRLEEVLAANTNLQKLNGHLSNKLGVLKKELPPMPTDTDMLEKPVEATQQVIVATLEKAKAEQEERTANRNRAIMEVAGSVVQIVPDFVEHIEDMAQILKTSGMPEEGLQLFRHNPAAVIMDVPHLVHLAERVKLTKQNAELRHQLDEAKKGPQKLAANLQGAAAAAPAISSTTVRTGPKKSSAPVDVTKMTTAELDAFIAENSKLAEETDEL